VIYGEDKKHIDFISVFMGFSMVNFLGKCYRRGKFVAILFFTNELRRIDMKKIWKMERGVNELYAADPERADWEIWGRSVQPHTRRGFLKKSGLLAMAWAVGGNIPFADKMPNLLTWRPAPICWMTR
jgi:hypothetical protein